MSAGPVKCPVYEEADIEVAAYLHAHGRRLLETTAIQGKPYAFVFEDEDGGCVALARAFLDSPEKTFAHSLNDMRRATKIAREAFASSRRR